MKSISGLAICDQGGIVTQKSLHRSFKKKLSSQGAKRNEQSQSLFLKNGFNPKTIVYPWGNPSNIGTELARQYFKYGVLYQGTNTGMLNFNSSFNYIKIPRNVAGNVNELKTLLDTCASSNKLFVWGTHSYQTGPIPSSSNLRQILEYAISLGIRILPFEQAIRLKEPVLTCGISDSTCISIFGDGTFNDRFVTTLFNKASELGLLNIEPGEVTTTGITVEYTGSNQNVGETVSLDNVIVNKLLSNGTHQVITSGYTLQNGSQTVLEGEHDYTIVYTENSNTFSGTFTMTGVVTVITTGISVTYTGGEQTIGNAVDMSNVLVNKMLSDGTSEVIPSGYSLQSGSEIVIAEENIYTITYNEDGNTFTGTFTIVGTLYATDFAINCTNNQISIPFSDTETTEYEITYTPANANRNLEISWSSSPNGLVIVTQTGKNITARSTAEFEAGQSLIGSLISNPSVSHTYEIIESMPTFLTSLQITNPNVMTYFDTNYIGNENTGVEIKISAVNGALFGARSTASSNAIYLYRNNQEDVLNIGFGSQTVGQIPSLGAYMYTYKLDKTGLYRDDVKIAELTANEPPFNTPLPILIGNVNDATGTTIRRNINSVSIMFIKIYQSGVLVHHFKPFLENGVPTFYDIITRNIMRVTGNAESLEYVE